MKIELHGLKNLEITGGALERKVPLGWIEAEVLHCAVCRTDAKIWSEGHRDLHLPRVPGHEMVVRYRGEEYCVWPGVACGNCRFCREGNENLCDDMEILGFHLDGGFADKVVVPERSLIPVPPGLNSVIATFAEPAGCVENAFRKIDLRAGDSLLIYGAGTVGILAALLARQRGAKPLILEKSETKIRKASEISRISKVSILKSTDESRFDAVLNACSDPLAFISGIPRCAKGARIGFFSGLDKNEEIESNLLNLIHYKELAIHGSYGLTLEDMKRGMNGVCEIQEELKLLVEKRVSPLEIEPLLPAVINGEKYKYVIDFGTGDELECISREPHGKSEPAAGEMETEWSIAPLSEEMRAEAQKKIDFKTKPLGALGILETLAVQMSSIQKSLNPVITRKSLFVFAADHGIAEEGVSAFPQEVTQQMVQNFLDGGAAINVLSRHNGIDLTIVDIGTKGSENTHPDLITCKIARGTKNFALERAMSRDEAERALAAGAHVFRTKQSEKPIDILGLGEMGIANTTSATAIISTITGLSPAECTGRGTGVDDQGLEHKIEVLEKALAFQKPDRSDAIDILSKIGGFEIAGIAGAALAAAENGSAVVLDGLISTAAGLIAYTINPAVADYFIAGHKSVEVGHTAALKHMGLSPVLDMQMRLGEGTGAALTIDLVDAACRIMREMATFEEAGISGKE